jgi:hypothetical protein
MLNIQKTTLLDILSNRKTVGLIGGSVFVNDVPRNSTFKRISGYVLENKKIEKMKKKDKIADCSRETNYLFTFLFFLFVCLFL